MISMALYIYVCVYICICIYMCVYICVCVYMHTYVYICMYICVYIYVYVYMCVYIYIFNNINLAFEKCAIIHLGTLNITNFKANHWTFCFWCLLLLVTVAQICIFYYSQINSLKLKVKFLVSRVWTGFSFLIHIVNQPP